MSENNDVKNIMTAIDLAIMAQVNLQLTLFDANKLKVHIDALNAEIAELRDQLRWIPVHVRPPEEDTMVEIKTEDGDVLVYQYQAYSDSWCDENLDHWKYNSEVTHWRPIPQTEVTE